MELLNYARERGFDLPPPDFSGKIHRFGEKKCKWYVAWQNGKFTNAVFGDWKTGEKHEYTNVEKTEKKDYAEFRKIVKEKSDLAEIERKKNQETVAEECARDLESFDKMGVTKYMQKKQINELFGALTCLEDSGRELIIATRDIDGKAWGYQRILPDGRKFFQAGQKTSGTFFQFGVVTDQLIICEGWATGASIYMAMSCAVFSAFNAGNMKNVALVLRMRYPQAKIIIAGDDDEVGRAKAKEAGNAVFPTDGCNDFNDLHVAKGLQAIRACFTSPAPGGTEEDIVVEEPVDKSTTWRALGYDESTHFFYDDRCKDIVKMTSFTDVQIMQLVPLERLVMDFPAKKSPVNWTDAKDFFIQASRAKGPFDVFRVRGTGVWLDNGKTVVNTGHSLFTTNQDNSRYFYIRTRNQMPPIHDKPLEAGETLSLRAVCESLRWEDMKSGYLLAGWIAIARIAGALPVRPHIWLTGGAGTGKSTVMDRVVRPGLGVPEGKYYLQGGTTEAGIRQAIKADSLPIIFDEFESTGDGSKERVQNLIELLRQTWSHTQGVVLKGSAGGVAVPYALSFAALVSSIRVNLDNDADRSRFSVLELKAHNSNMAEWQGLKELMTDLTEEFGERLFARSIKMVPVILKSYATLADELAAAVNQRFGQQMGMLLAGYYSLVSDEPISKEAAAGMVTELGFHEEKDEAAQTDEWECLNYLWQKRIVGNHPDGQRFDDSIGEMVTSGLPFYFRILKNYGIIVEPGEQLFFVANDHTELRALFRGTRWETCYRKSLARLPDVKRGRLKWFAGKQSRCTEIKLSILKA